MLHQILEIVLRHKVAILTFILTPFFSGIIVYFQIRKSHLYWKKQQSFLRDNEIEKSKILTYRETVELINHLNDAILNHHIYASNRDVSFALSSILKNKFPNEAKHFGEEYVSQKKKAEESYLNVRTLSIRFSGLGVNIKIYFNQQIFNLYSDLQNAFKDAQKPIMSVATVHTNLDRQIQKHSDYIKAQEELANEYDNLIDKQARIQKTNNFLTELMTEFEINKTNR